MEINLIKSYMSMIENSVGTKMFRNNFFDIDGNIVDILKNGEDSCAYFVSSILKIFNLIEAVHCTVDGTIEDMKKNGRKEYKGKNIDMGSILVWEEKNGHKHIGFYIGNNEAISNNSIKKEITKHHFEYNGKRKIEKTLINSNILVGN
ncbi:C40 family peptidase [Candidatus Gracilibacteria bacterium]|nr:C40 family peptidase [Candidatus Gracilibacteria bacterium]